MSTKYTVTDLGYAFEIVQRKNSGGARTIEAMTVDKSKADKLVRDLQAAILASKPKKGETAYVLNVYVKASKAPADMIDKSLFEAVGRYSGASGTDLETGERDHSWDFTSRRGAEAAEKRVKALKRKGVRTEVKQA